MFKLSQGRRQKQGETEMLGDTPAGERHRPRGGSQPRLFLEACDAVPHELQHPLREVAEARVIDGGYLGWLLRAGRVAAIKRGGR
jgi:hypothetical protein